MNQTLTTLLLSMGCSEYNLNRIPPEIEAPSQDSDTGSNEHLVTYDSCDPYDAGWAISPEGPERADCFGIEGYAQIDEDGHLTTQVYYGGCDFDFEQGITIASVTYQNDSYYNGEVGHGGGYPHNRKCDGDFYYFTWSDQFITNSDELSNLSLEENIWMLSREETDFCTHDYEGFSSECWYEIHEPLVYTLECNEGATSIEDCIAFLYR